MPTFDPAGPALLTIDAAATSVSVSVQVAVDAAVVPAEVITGIRAEHTLPPPFVVSVDEPALRVDVTAPSVFGLFPAQFVRYRDATGAIGQVGSFGALPPNTTNITGYRPSAALNQTYTLSVFVDVEGVGEVENAYTVVVEANFNAGRAALLAAIEEYG